MVSEWNRRLIAHSQDPQSTYCHKRIVDAFFVYHSTSTIPTEKNWNHINIAAEQLTDNLLSKIIQALQTKDPSQECHMDPEDHRTPLFRKHLKNFYLEPVTSVLMIRDSTHTPKLVVPYKLRCRFLYQAHDCIDHSGVTRMRVHLASYWWEYKNSKHRSIHWILRNLCQAERKLWQTATLANRSR